MVDSSDSTAETPDDSSDDADATEIEATSTKSKSASRKNEEVNAGNIKETIESILVAFILAFIFRAFIVEAFVIPTGSMATTLMVAHARFHCPDCGYDFDVNFNIPQSSKPGNIEGDDTFIPSDGPIVMPVYCPNCGLQLKGPTRLPPKGYAVPQKDLLPIAYGDRILVLKYLYMNFPGAGRSVGHFPFGPPQRWDVVVFKSPVDPAQYDYGQNYIKRLVGTPGERLMVLDGDVYIKEPGETKFKIQVRPRVSQESLWRIVYDNDFHPQGIVPRPDPWKQPWTATGPASAQWKQPTPRQFAYSGDAAAALTFDPAANPSQHSLTDFLAYNQSTYPLNTVTDLKLEADYMRQKGDGPVRFSLSKYDHVFTAEITPGKVRLLERIGNGQETELQSVDFKDAAGSSQHVEFTNVDYRVTIRIDGHDLIVTREDQYHPDVTKLIALMNQMKTMAEHAPLPDVSISADHQTCLIDHLKLWRDIYYTSPDAGNLAHWASPNSTPPGILLGDDEYFMMGDNSDRSLDARYWDDPINLMKDEDLRVQSGRVPGRFLLGKAFFVYWPAGYRPFGLPVSIVPNFGNMRFIH